MIWRLGMEIHTDDLWVSGAAITALQKLRFTNIEDDHTAYKKYRVKIGQDGREIIISVWPVKRITRYLFIGQTYAAMHMYFKRMKLRELMKHMEIIPFWWKVSKA